MPQVKHIELDLLEDGSWTAEAIKFDKKIEAHEATPEAALSKILTHE